MKEVTPEQLAEFDKDAAKLVAVAQQQATEYRNFWRSQVGKITLDSVRPEVDGTISITYAFPDELVQLAKDLLETGREVDESSVVKFMKTQRMKR
ncbi:hypothetical protein KKD37_04780 [Patescibacteria group bacterium]|nr:hypothetical protein [Patescibacteria group bacterium]